jgi:hypothetical protein
MAVGASKCPKIESSVLHYRDMVSNKIFNNMENMDSTEDPPSKRQRSSVMQTSDFCRVIGAGHCCQFGCNHDLVQEVQSKSIQCRSNPHMAHRLASMLTSHF